MIRLLSRILITALFIPIAGLAQTASPAAAAGKIVWLNMDTTVISCDEGKGEFAKIQQFVDEKKAEMDTMRKEYESLKNQESVQGSKLTDEARADLQFQITQRETQLQRFQQDTQQEINNKRDRVYSYIIKRLQPVIEKIARDKSLSAVLLLNPNRDIWIDPTLDITDEIVKAYNAAYPVAKPKATAPASGTP